MIAFHNEGKLNDKNNNNNNNNRTKVNQQKTKKVKTIRDKMFILTLSTISLCTQRRPFRSQTPQYIHAVTMSAHAYTFAYSKQQPGQLSV